MGKRYIIEHIVSEYRFRQKELIYRSYIGDCLTAIADNYVKVNSRDNNAEAVKVRLYDILNPKKEEEKTAEHIAVDILARSGLHFAKGEKA